MAAFFGRLGGWLYQQPYLLVSLTYLMWSLNIVLGRYSAGYIPPVTLGVGRWAFAALILIPFAWPHLKRDWPALRAHLPLIALLSVTGTTGYAVPSYWGLQYTEAINGLLIQCTMPLTVGFIAYVLVGERLSLGQVIGGILSLIGVAVILTRGQLEVLRHFTFNAGDFWFIFATLVFSIYIPLVRKSPKVHPLSFLAVTAALGTLILLPLNVWEITQRGMPPVELRSIAIVAYMALFPSLLAYFFYNRSVQLMGPNPVAAFYPLIIVFGSVIAIVFLGESFHLFHLVGSALIVLGVWLAAWMSRRPIATPA